MIRSINEFVARIEDTVGLGLTVLFMLVAAALVAAGWYFWPRWLRWKFPAGTGSGRRWRWPKLRWPRWKWSWRRRRRGRDTVAAQLEPHETEGLPELSVEAFVSLADRLAAQGRYAEAVRERLRGIVRELVDAGVVEHRPGYTITELAAAASLARPTLRIPLDAASLLFSDIWYGQRPATADHDAQMRRYAAQVHAELTPVAVTS
jgi:hypothetical protein